MKIAAAEDRSQHTRPVLIQCSRHVDVACHVQLRGRRRIPDADIPILFRCESASNDAVRIYLEISKATKRGDLSSRRVGFNSQAEIARCGQAQPVGRRRDADAHVAGVGDDHPLHVARQEP